MYNESAKQRFLSEYIRGDRQRSASTETAITRIFKAIEPIESEYDKDFAQMNLDEMQRAFNSASGIRSQSAESTYFLLKQYIRWCAANGMDGSDVFGNIRMDSVEKFRSISVASPAHLKMSLDAAFPNPDSNEIEYIYRASLWLAFIGFEDFEAITIRKDDVKFERMVIETKDCPGSHVIYAEAVHDIGKACTLTEFIEPRGQHGVTKQREFGDLILRGKVTNKTMEEFMMTTMRQTINRAFKSALNRYVKQGEDVPRSLSLSLSHERVLRSGICYRAYESERVGQDPHGKFELLAELELNRKLASGECNLTTPHRTRGKIYSVILKRYLDDYALWKCAFTI